MNHDDELFGSVMFVSLSLDAVTLLPFVFLVVLAENNPQHNQ